MMKIIIASLRMLLCLSLLTGVLYPLLITGIASLTMKQKAEGGFISAHGKIVGAKLIAQKFEEDKYFWGRPSSIDYSPLPSGGSNLAPTSAALKKIVEERQVKLQKAHPQAKGEIPRELLFASGSGIDPHLSVKAVRFQADRVAKARGLESKFIESLIDHMTIKPSLGFLEEGYVNILLLNLKLDEVQEF